MASVVEKLENILLPTVNGVDPGDDKPLVIGILKFLTYLLKNSIHKRYFLILEVNYLAHFFIVFSRQHKHNTQQTKGFSPASYDCD